MYYGERGNIGAIVPSIIPRGSTATLLVTVHNTSVFQDTSVLAPYTFSLYAQVTLSPAGTLILSRYYTLSMAADETATVGVPFTIPINMTATSGSAFAILYQPLSGGGQQMVAWTTVATFTIT